MYMPKISLIGWVWHSAQFWQLISCYELSSCHKNLTSDIVCRILLWKTEFEILLYFDSLSVVTSCQAVIKKFDSRYWLGDSKSNCMPKISLIGRVGNFALFWQLISCHKLSSCHKKVLTPEIDWGIANLTVCQKSVWLTEFEILLSFDSSSVVTSCQAVLKMIWLQELIEG